MRRLHKFWAIPRREKQFFFEAAALLLLSHLCIKTIAFKYIDSSLRGQWNDGTSDGVDHTDDTAGRFPMFIGGYPPGVGTCARVKIGHAPSVFVI